MRYMKVWGLGMMGFAFAATMVFGQGNQERGQAHTRRNRGVEGERLGQSDRCF